MEKEMKDYIHRVIAPKLQGDGGWIEFISCRGDELKVMLQGECSKCEAADRCMAWVAGEIERDMDKKVNIVPVRSRPFFWDR